MSGGDGRGHNTGAHSTSGNINGGPTGLGVGGGASDGSGWSSENNPWGGGSGSGIHWGVVPVMVMAGGMVIPVVAREQAVICQQ